MFHAVCLDYPNKDSSEPASCDYHIHSSGYSIHLWIAACGPVSFCHNLSETRADQPCLEDTQLSQPEKAIDMSDMYGYPHQLTWRGTGTIGTMKTSILVTSSARDCGYGWINVAVWCWWTIVVSESLLTHCPFEWFPHPLLLIPHEKNIFESSEPIVVYWLPCANGGFHVSLKNSADVHSLFPHSFPW